MRHDAEEKVIVEVRHQWRVLQALLHYLESQPLWSEEDLRYCRSTLRRSARELLATSRGPLGAIDMIVLGTGWSPSGGALPAPRIMNPYADQGVQACNA